MSYETLKDVMKQEKDVRSNAGNKGAGGNDSNNGEETISYWFDLPISVAEFEEKLGSVRKSRLSYHRKVLPFADEVHEHTSVYQLNELDFMYRQLSSDMQEEYVSLLTVYENLEALYICRNVITVIPTAKA